MNKPTIKEVYDKILAAGKPELLAMLFDLTPKTEAQRFVIQYRAGLMQRYMAVNGYLAARIHELKRSGKDCFVSIRELREYFGDGVERDIHHADHLFTVERLGKNGQGHRQWKLTPTYQVVEVQIPTQQVAPTDLTGRPDRPNRSPRPTQQVAPQSISDLSTSEDSLSDDRLDGETPHHPSKPQTKTGEDAETAKRREDHSDRNGEDAIKNPQPKTASGPKTAKTPEDFAVLYVRNVNKLTKSTYEHNWKDISNMSDMLEALPDVFADDRTFTLKVRDFVSSKPSNTFSSTFKTWLYDLPSAERTETATASAPAQKPAVVSAMTPNAIRAVCASLSQQVAERAPKHGISEAAYILQHSLKGLVNSIGPRLARQYIAARSDSDAILATFDARIASASPERKAELAALDTALAA